MSDICAVVLVVSALCGTTVVSQLLSGPSNVHLTSHNMDLVLRWEPPEGAAGGLLYTTEYRSVAFYFSCEKTCFLSTFTTLLFYFSAFIGPPTVSLFSSGATLEVGIQDPVFMISALRNVYNGATYNITYWKKDQNEKARSIYNIQQNRLVLNDLEPRTKYCVQVQINTDRNPNPSQPSSIICENTANEQETPWVAAVVAFVTMAVAVTLVVVAVVYWKSISQFLCPKDALPLHFKESLLAHPNSTMYLAMQSSHPVEEIYHPISIIAGDRTVEEGDPLEAAGSSCGQQSDVIVEE
ncbi:interleukin-10 receptor subunit beta-like [Stegastes partitus]|uniref:Interleukin-10 receptor subunit beta-like n=1 Tax=Stegastes partitus TaxID=144197 RepID=A0A9Y4N0P5_9TELE|nr:PREDICTED: interleukin-10 receptor subunit beta-like [Stegastes partitus]